MVVEEGDLYQRVYTVVSGQLHMKFRDRVMLTIEEGEVFGYSPPPPLPLFLKYYLF